MGAGKRREGGVVWRKKWGGWVFKKGAGRGTKSKVFRLFHLKRLSGKYQAIKEELGISSLVLFQKKNGKKDGCQTRKRRKDVNMLGGGLGLEFGIAGRAPM